ncbi:MAG TPA: gamma-glutamyl-gamma-aminobutyrate hydrolase family protein [Candidatus Acidoferrales bacterium]|nr:gamma-glutamyl-gamma-aminobutyrate hydrolase family protein [Candidatus Acidoferrales bacterium]
MLIQNNRESRPRIGVPYRKLAEQLNGIHEKYGMYVRSVEHAGGTAVPIALNLSSDELERQACDLDAVVLPGSPADVDPSHYGSARGPHTADADIARDATDLALLRHCFSESKPVLAICYGVQILNVYLGGSLIQDIPSEVQTNTKHAAEKGASEAFHDVIIEAESRIACLAEYSKQRVNSSHHQAIHEPGRGLRVTARADDGIVEAAEWGGDSNWVIGVQWHPERMTDNDPFARKLFESLVAAARNAAVRG